MVVVDGFQFQEQIEDFRFNEKGGISVLKKWRELAVICQVDIEIVSISRENYRNYASIPANGFYGYATLIMRDFALAPIKICQPRQTLYYARNDSALANWFTYVQMLRVQENFIGVENLECFNTGLLGGACIPKVCRPIPSFKFDEIPLREVMVKADYGTQFVLEYSFWHLLPELDNCGNIVTPKSNQTDRDKDSGLPPNGSSPQSGDKNNPYLGLPNPDGTDREGVLPPSKLDNQDNPNPDNAPIPPQPKWVGINHFQLSSTCATLYTAQLWFAVAAGDVAQVNLVRSIRVCDPLVTVDIVQMKGIPSNALIGIEIYAYGDYTLQYSYEDTKPADIFTPSPR